MEVQSEAAGVLKGVMVTQSEIMGAMEKLLVNFKKDSSARRTPSNIKRRLETLDTYWQEFQDNHFRLVDEVLDKASHTYFTENYYKQTEKFYKETRSFIEKLTTLSDTTMQEQRSTSKESASTLTPTPVGKQGSTQWPKEETREISQDTNLVRNLLRKQEANFMAFKRTLGMIEVDTTLEKWELEDSLKSLQMRWSEVDKLHWQIICETGEENSEYEGKFSFYEKKYINTKKAINTKIWSMIHREKATPQLDIPIFSGNYNQWVPFKNLFCEAIHDNPSVSNAQKMQFLRSKVRGDAERLIQHLQISSENYNTCWDILNNRYNNKKLIFTSHINTLLSLPNIQQQSAGQIKKIHDVTVEALNAIKNLDVDISTWDPLLIHLLSQKLDSETHSDYIESLKNPRELPILSEFLEFLEGKFTALESSRRKQENIQQKPNNYFNKEYPTTSKWTNANQGRNNNIQQKNTKTFSKSFFVSSNFKCPLCSRDHGIYNCKSFLEMPSDQKLRTVNRLKLCTNCLFSHNGSSCTSTKMCRKCAKQHSTILHDAFTPILPTQASTSRSSNANCRNENITTNSHISQNNYSEILLATAVLKVKAVDGTYHNMRALVDQGSQISIITEKASQQLGIKRQKCQGTIFGVGEKENACKGMSNIECRSVYNDFTFNAEVLIMNNLIKSLPNKSFEQPSWNHISNINLADPEFNKSRPVDLLLGADIYSIIILSGIIKGEDTSQPIAQQTQLGWLLSGNAKTYHCNVVTNNLDDIKQFWNIEEISEQSNLSIEEQECVNFFTETTVRKEDGRYEVRLPLKQGTEQKLGSSKHMAIAQFRNLENKFNKHIQLSIDYKSFMNEYLSLGHMKLDTDNNAYIECYLPHHGVQKEESTTTKYRVVFNASAKTSSGYSLNDLMHAGPNLQHDLQTLLLRWRQYKYAFTADIEKMFRQLLISEQDQGLQKIIYRETQTQPIQAYKLTTVTYGTKAAPFLAMMTLRRLAADERETYPEAAAVLESAMYMDDLVQGSETIEDGKKLITDLISLLKSAGMNLRKWASNENELLLNIQQKHENKDDSIFTFKSENTKTLGLGWNSSTDKFTFQCNISETNKKLTKRSLLSEISKLFDPLGWLTPLSTKLKLLFQKLWKLNLRWDDGVPEDIIKEWSKIKTDISLIKTFEIPRWIKSEADDVITLHGFCDASEQAYACVIYAHIKGRQEATLVAAKSKLVPFKKALSLPRLELSGALLLAKLTDKIKQSLNKHVVEVCGWSDSMVTLGWIQGEPSRWKPFVANRVEKIIKTIPSYCWRYVKSKENPADAASRGLYVSQLKEHLLWWNGPSWLSTDNIQQTEMPKYNTDLELRSKYHKQTNIAQTGDNKNIIDTLLHKYNSITFILHIIAWILRVRSLNSQSQRKQLPKHITLQERNKATFIIVKYVQATEFRTDIDSIQKHGVVKNNSKLLNLYPFIGEDGVLRVGGRLKHSCLTFEMKHPVIIPANHRLATLLINKAHLETFHGGPTLTLARLRKQYWITGGVNIVKKHLRNCVTCRKQEPRPQHQLMGDLPEARTNPAPPFYHTGVDYTGFMEVKLNKARGARTTKGYVAVFICMVTKAIHLELVSDLTSSAFLAALRRMAARRGTPAHLYSDNGTNFHGAHNILQQEFQQIKQTFNDCLLKEVEDMNIEWHFTAPSWPSSGGLWERAVRSLKHHLKRVVGQQKLTFEEFSTILAQLEACLNSRPLCALTENIDDLSILTPAHFLTGRADVTVIETAEDARTRWHLTTKIFQETWKRWKDEYLGQLTARRKWLQPQQNIKEGDVVVIQDDNLPAGKWAIGRVTETHPGPDGYVRVVTLKTRNGFMKRPVVKLSILPIESSQQKTEQNSNEDERSKQQNKKPKKTGSTLSTIIMTLLYLFTLFTNSFAASVITELNNNLTLYFDPIANIQLSRDTWNLVVYYDMNPYWEGNEAYEKIHNYITSTCEILSSDSQCNMIVPQLNHQFAELQYYNQLLLNQHFNRHARRRRRGLINGVGYLANTLFGVLDDRFAEQYTRDIDTIRKNQAHINNLWKNQTSIIESEFNLLKRTEDMIARQHKIINKHLNNVEKTITVLEKQVNRVSLTEDFTLSVIAAQQMLQTLKSIQQTLLDTLTDIYQEHFNIHLLTPKQLITELNTISGLLSADVTVPIHNIQSDFKDIYKLLKIKARMTESYFIFEIKIPLISRDTYDLYKIISLPQRMGRYMRNILPTSDQIAISLQKDSYIPVSQEDFLTCIRKDSTTLICSLSSPIYKLKNDQDLCVRDENKLDQCKTNIVACQSKWHALAKLNTYLFICCGQCQVRTICKDQVTAHQVTSPSIISIGGDCLLKTDNFTVFAHKKHESTLTVNENLEINFIAPINHIINISMGQPDTSFNYTNNLNNEQLTIEIEKKIQSLKDAELSSDFDPVSSHDIHQYTLLYGILAGAISLGTIIICRRMRRRSRAEAEAPPAPVSAVGQAAARPGAPAPPPARSTSMCQLSGVSECDSARVRKFHSETELKVLKAPSSVPKRLVFSEV